MKKSFFAILTLLTSLHCSAQDNTTRNLMWAANTALVLDWAQTRHIADDPNYYEKNSLIGTQPTTRQVNQYFIGSILLTNLTAYLLPESKKSMFYGSVLVYELSYINRNKQIGIRFEF